MHDPVTMIRTTNTRWILPFTAILLLSGCTPDTARWSELEAPKENTVQFTTLSYTVRFAPGAATLSPGVTEDLREFISTSVASGDRVSIAVDGPDQATSAGLASKRQAVLAKFLAKHAVNVVVDVVQPRGPGQTRNSGLIQVGRYIVTPPRCPDWTKPEADDYANTRPSNFGCAVTTNLGLMVANPADLVRGSGMGTADGIVAARAVDQYRTSSRSLSQGSGASSGGGGGGQGGGNSGGGN
jgi:pilus assembly protein CpaD